MMPNCIRFLGYFQPQGKYPRIVKSRPRRVDPKLIEYVIASIKLHKKDPLVYEDIFSNEPVRKSTLPPKKKEFYAKEVESPSELYKRIKKYLEHPFRIY